MAVAEISVVHHTQVPVPPAEVGLDQALAGVHSGAKYSA